MTDAPPDAPAPDRPTSPAAPRWRPAAGTAARRAGRLVRRYAVASVVSAVVLLPVAFAWAIGHTQVEERLGTSPTTLSLTTSGHSEVRLGIAGTVFVPRTDGPLGLVATVEGPGDLSAGSGDLASYVSPRALELYTGLFHDPEAAIEEYVGLLTAELRHQLAVAVLVSGLGGGAAVLLLLRIVPPRPQSSRREAAVRAGLVAALVLATGTGASALSLSRSGDDSAGVYALTALDGTPAAGSTTNSPLIRALLGGAFAKAEQLVDRQEAQEAAYRETAQAGLTEQQDLMEGPREGETAVLMQSDMHCNTTMIRLQASVVSMLHETYGDDVPALMAVAGDLTTNGTAAEGPCIRDEAAIADGAPIAAITGNHESDVSAEQMADAGMTVLDGSIEDVGGLRVLGDGDPSRSELFGGTGLRGDETQQEQGARIRAEAEDAGGGPGDRPDLVLLHEGYAIAEFLGVDNMRTLMDEPDSPTSPAEDGVDDVPAGAVFYGHWHRSIEPRVLWNSDGTWTLLMELDTSGGAIATPTLGRFSTPWSQPLQEAAFPVVFLDQETRLVTGYQLYRFEPDGTATVLPRVDVGRPPES